MITVADAVGGGQEGCVGYSALSAVGRKGSRPNHSMTFGPDALMSGAAAMDIGNQRGAATAAGLINGMGSCGQLISPLLVAYVADHFGWDSMFYLFVVFAIISGTLLATKWNYGKRVVPAS